MEEKVINCNQVTIPHRDPNRDVPTKRRGGSTPSGASRPARPRPRCWGEPGPCGQRAARRADVRPGWRCPPAERAGSGSGAGSGRWVRRRPPRPGHGGGAGRVGARLCAAALQGPAVSAGKRAAGQAGPRGPAAARSGRVPPRRSAGSRLPCARTVRRSVQGSARGLCGASQPCPARCGVPGNERAGGGGARAAEPPLCLGQAGLRAG